MNTPALSLLHLQNSCGESISEWWAHNTVDAGDRAVHNGSLIKQLSTRKSAMSALSHKLDATSAAAAGAHKDLETAAVRLDGALTELSKVRSYALRAPL